MKQCIIFFICALNCLMCGTERAKRVFVQAAKKALGTEHLPTSAEQREKMLNSLLSRRQLKKLKCWDPEKPAEKISALALLTGEPIFASLQEAEDAGYLYDPENNRFHPNELVLAQTTKGLCFGIYLYPDEPVRKIRPMHFCQTELNAGKSTSVVFKKIQRTPSLLPSPGSPLLSPPIKRLSPSLSSRRKSEIKSGAKRS